MQINADLFLCRSSDDLIKSLKFSCKIVIWCVSKYIHVNRYNPRHPCSILFGTLMTLINADSRRFFSVCKSSDDLIKNRKFSLQDSHLITFNLNLRKSAQSALSVFNFIVGCYAGDLIKSLNFCWKIVIWWLFKYIRENLLNLRYPCSILLKNIKK
jgi:hypothetical protein